MGHTGGGHPRGWVKDARGVVRTSVPRRAMSDAHAAPQLDLSTAAKAQQTILLLGQVALTGSPVRRKPGDPARPKKAPLSAAAHKLGKPGAPPPHAKPHGAKPGSSSSRSKK